MHSARQLAAALLTGATFLATGEATAQAPTPRLDGAPRLHVATGSVGVGRPTFHVTFRTERAVSGVDGARNLTVRVSGSTGRTRTVANREPGASRTCFRAGFRPYQRTPEPRRLKPGVRYRVTFFQQRSSTGARTVFATRTLRARSFVATSRMSTPSPCRP